MEASHAYTLTINAGTFNQQQIEVRLNGRTVGVIDSPVHWQPADYRFSLTADDLYQIRSATPMNSLDFIIPQAASPADLDPANGEVRVLGLCLWHISVQ